MSSIVIFSLQGSWSVTVLACMLRLGCKYIDQKSMLDTCWTSIYASIQCENRSRYYNMYIHGDQPEFYGGFQAQWEILSLCTPSLLTSWRYDIYNGTNTSLSTTRSVSDAQQVARQTTNYMKGNLGSMDEHDPKLLQGASQYKSATFL